MGQVRKLSAPLSLVLGFGLIGFGVLAGAPSAVAKARPRILRGSFVIDGSWAGAGSGDMEGDSCRGTGTLAAVDKNAHVVLYKANGKPWKRFFTLPQGTVDNVANSDLCEFTFRVKDSVPGKVLKMKIGKLGPYRITVNVPFSHVLDPSNSPTADVTLNQCVIDPNDSTNTTADVGGTIVNHSSLTDDYDIQVNILEGTTRIGSAEDIETTIAPGQTSTWLTYGNMTPATGITCQIVNIGRTPST
jgi:hypothetical protein